jgi:hypothetical protein
MIEYGMRLVRPGVEWLPPSPCWGRGNDYHTRYQPDAEEWEQGFTRRKRR